MTRDANLGLVLGVILVMVMAVLFFQKRPEESPGLPAAAAGAVP